MFSSSINTLQRALRLSTGQFSLLLVRCAYRPLRATLLTQLMADERLSVRLLSLPENTQNLLTTLQAAQTASPDDAPWPALLVTGLEQIEDLETLFASTNQLRDEFPRLLPCPLVLWLTDSVLQCLIRTAPDFESWGTTVEFTWNDAQLLAFIEQKAATLLAEWLDPDAVLPSLPQAPGYDPSQLEELQTAQQDLRTRGMVLPTSVQASLDLLRACDAQAGSETARLAYEASLAVWRQQPTSELNQAVCLILLAYNQQIAAQHQPRLRETAWAAVQAMQQALQHFQNLQREDLYAKFINSLGQLLLLQLSVTDTALNSAKSSAAQRAHSDLLEQLEQVANAAAALHKKPSPRLAQAQALAAEVAYRRGNRALLPTPAAAALCDARDQAWFELLKALAAKQPQLALQHLHNGLQRLAPHTDAHLYLRLLRTQRQVYFALHDYLAAFRVKLYQYDLEQQFDLRAFNGAGRLREGVNWESSFDISGRNQDVQKLLARMERDDQPLTVIYGPSGVGKSSLIQAGLVSALRRTRVHARPLLPVLQTVYTDWAKELLQILQDIQPLRVPTPVSSTRIPAEQVIAQIIRQLRQFTARNYLVVLIFEQFEEFFFACPNPVQRKIFYEFLQVCLDLPEVKVILALREDYLHHLLECNERLSELPAVNNNILDKKILYYLGNFSREQAKTVILSLTHNTPFQLEADLIEALLDDFAEEGGSVRPIELQIVGNQLQHENLRTLDAYRAHGPKTALVERYVQTVVQDCGAEHERLASLVLYLLTDEDNTRPLKTRAELAEILNAQSNDLDLVLAILTQSRLVFVQPGDPAPYYQLVHDYLVPFIRRQQSEELQAQLESEQRQRRYSEAELKRVLAHQRRRDYRMLGLIALLCVAAVTWVMRAETGGKVQVQTLTVKRLWRSNQQLDALLVGLQQAQLLNSWQGHTLPQYERHTALLALQDVLQGMIEVNRLEGHRRRVLSIAYSADGRRLASTGNDGETLIWDTHGQLRARLEHIQAYRPPMPVREAEQQTYELPIWSAAFHPNGRTLAVAVNMRRRQMPPEEADYAVELWSLQCAAQMPEADCPTLQRSLHGHQGTIYSVSFSPDGRWLASADDQHSIRLWTAEGDFVRELVGHTAPVHRVLFRPDSQLLLSVSDDKSLRLWGLDGTERGVLRGHEDWVLNAAFSPDGRYVASVGRDGVRVWQLLRFPSEAGERIQGIQLLPAHSKAQRHEDYVWGVAFSADGQWITTAGLDKVIKIWRFRPSQSPPLQLINTLPGHQRGVLSLAFNPQQPNQLASAGLDNQVHLWRVEPARYTVLRGAESYAGKADEPTFTHLAFSPDSQLLATGSQEGEVILWDNRGRRYATLQHRNPLRRAHEGSITALSFSPDGAHLVSADSRGELFLWDRQGRLRQTLPGHAAGIRQISFSPDGAVLVSSGLDGVVRVWRGDGEAMDTLAGYAAAFSPSGQYLAIAPWDGLIRLLHLDGSQAYSLSDPTYSNTQIRFSPDGKLLFSSTWQGDIDIWGSQGQHLAQVQRQQHGLGLQYDSSNDFSISPDSRSFALGLNDGRVQIWSIAGTLMRTLNAHQGAVTQVRFSPDGQWLATAGVDRSIYLWQRNGRLLASFQEHEDLILGLGFSPDGHLLASSSADKSVRLWSLDFDLASARERGCAWGLDYLTHSQAVSTADRKLCDQ